jgi:hypothetical protein
LNRSEKRGTVFADRAMAGFRVAQSVEAADHPTADNSATCMPAWRRTYLGEDFAHPGSGGRTRFGPSRDSGPFPIDCAKLSISHAGGFAPASMCATARSEHDGGRQ